MRSNRRFLLPGSLIDQIMIRKKRMKNKNSPRLTIAILIKKVTRKAKKEIGIKNINPTSNKNRKNPKSKWSCQKSKHLKFLQKRISFRKKRINDKLKVLRNIRYNILKFPQPFFAEIISLFISLRRFQILLSSSLSFRLLVDFLQGLSFLKVYLLLLS